jgi:hypothetical protein
MNQDSTGWTPVTEEHKFRWYCPRHDVILVVNEGYEQLLQDDATTNKYNDGKKAQYTLTMDSSGLNCPEFPDEDYDDEKKYQEEMGSWEFQVRTSGGTK